MHEIPIIFDLFIFAMVTMFLVGILIFSTVMLFTFGNVLINKIADRLEEKGWL